MILRISICERGVAFAPTALLSGEFESTQSRLTVCRNRGREKFDTYDTPDIHPRGGVEIGVGVGFGVLGPAGDSVFVLVVGRRYDKTTRSYPWM
jgi:hypothetical protein